jgi:transcriptional regulator with XRE-family HTH domain
MRLRDRQLLAQLVEGTGLSERELARQAGLGHATLNHLLTARRESCSVATALALSSALLCPPTVLFMAEHPGEQQTLLQISAEWEQPRGTGG